MGLRPKINIKIDIDSIIQTFQNLSYIGEMKERWEEIKRLQNKPAFEYMTTR